MYFVLRNNAGGAHGHPTDDSVAGGAKQNGRLTRPEGQPRRGRHKLKRPLGRFRATSGRKPAQNRPTEGGTGRAISFPATSAGQTGRAILPVADGPVPPRGKSPRARRLNPPQWGGLRPASPSSTNPSPRVTPAGTGGSPSGPPRRARGHPRPPKNRGQAFVRQTPPSRYALVLPGRRSAFRPGFWPDCCRESTEIGTPAGLRPAGEPISVLSR